MKYYIAADGGGTKLLAILYDENLHIINTALTAGANSTFKPVDMVVEDMRKLTSSLIPEGIDEIEGADIAIVRDTGVFENILSQRCRVKDYRTVREGEAALAAAGERYGIVAQAGTGSNAFTIQPDMDTMTGGWGALLGDQGSGYDIGLKALRAAVYSVEGIGPKTLIYDIIRDEWKLSAPRDMIEVTSNERDYRRLVASVTHIAERAANAGDEIAIKIFEDAGHELALHVFGAIKKHGGDFIGPIVASGGAWKGPDIMYEAFRDDCLKKFPDCVVKQPIFEPVVGCLISRQLASGKEYSEIGETLKKEFGGFLYNKGKIRK